MDKIEKILKKLSAKEQQAMMLLIEQLKDDYRKIPGIKPLKGKRGFYRVRVGRYRIIFAVHSKTKEVEIRRITKRDEKSYKNL